MYFGTTDCTTRGGVACVVPTIISESLDLTSVARDFVSVNSRRLKYLGKY